MSMRRCLQLFVFMLACSVCAHAVAATQVDTQSLRLTFDDSGNLQSAVACFPGCKGENVRIQQFGDSGVIRFEPGASGRWSHTLRRTETHHELTFRNDSGARLSWRIPVHGFLLELQPEGVSGLTLASGESFRPREAAGFGNWLEQSRYVILNAGDAEQVALQDTDVAAMESDRWLGYRNRYWTLMAAPPSAVTTTPVTVEENQDAEIKAPMAAGDWSFYIGPVEPALLADAGLDQLLYAGLWFWLRWICFALFHLLAFIHLVIPSWGLSIMVLSVAVNILMTPLSRIADRLQDQVNDTEARLAPELERIKKNFRGEEQAAKILALFKTERVHPLYSLKSLMGVAVVIPVFIGAFDMLAENIHLLHTGFLWISDLSRPDDLFNLPFTLPFFGNELNLLPFLMTGLSVVASSLHNPPALTVELRRKQVRNMLLLAAAFFVLFYTFPAGMVLYWTTNNLISVSKSLWARR
jgi:YidC/Oxa1 family membrane protein insertase